MRDPNKNVTFTFRCYEKESVDLKIRLKHDGLQQGQFFESVMRLYIDKDPLMMDLVQKIKETEKVMGKKKIARSREEMRLGDSALSKLGITQSDKNDIFDLLELNLEDYYE